MIKHPELSFRIDELYKRIAGKDATCYHFLVAFDEYFDDVLKFIEHGPHDVPNFIGLLARTNTIYSLPYYSRNAQMLHVSVTQAFNSLADGLAWKNSPETWRVLWSETGRLFWVDVVLAVAGLKLGFLDLRKLSGEVKELAWASRKA